MNKFSFLYLIFFYCIASIFTLYGDIELDKQIIGSLSLIIIFGIPHGAIDNVILMSTSQISAAKFYIFYIFSIISYLIIWFIAPNFAFMFFLAMSAYHFGESQLANYNLPALFNKPSYLLWGISLISTLIYYNKNELYNLFSLFEDTINFNDLLQFKIIEIIFWISNISLFLLFIYLKSNNKIQTSTFTSEIFQIILIHITFILFPIIIGFTLYFIFLHSIKVLTQEFGYLKKMTENLSLFKFVKMLTPYTFISLLFVSIFLFISKTQIINISLLLFAIISFSVITLPHAIVMTKFYDTFKK